MKRKEIQVRSFIQIGDQEEVEFESLPVEQQKEISKKLNEKLMTTAGYRKITKEEPA